MKSRRRRFILLFILVLVLAGLFAVPAIYWPTVGWLRGEAFFEGRPTSYWSREVAQVEPEGDRWAPPGMGIPMAPASNGFRDALEAIGIVRPASSPLPPVGLLVLGDGDKWSLDPQAKAEAIPVLRELTKDSNAFVRTSMPAVPAPEK